MLSKRYQRNDCQLRPSKLGRQMYNEACPRFLYKVTSLHGRMRSSRVVFKIDALCTQKQRLDRVEGSALVAIKIK